MRRLLQIVQTHLHVTRNEALAVAAVSTIVVTGSLGSRLFPLDAGSGLHDHTSVETIMRTLDSLSAVELPAASSPNGAPNVAPPGRRDDSTSTSSASKPAGRIPINSATASELEQLPGIGPAMAKRIIERRRIRKFTSAEDLLDVKGIGQKTLEKLRPFISVP